jgi:hypothetical protein
MNNFRMIQRKINTGVSSPEFIGVEVSNVLWSGNDFPTPEDAMEAIGKRHTAYPFVDKREGLIIQESRIATFLGRTVVLPFWKDVACVAENLMLLNEPKFERSSN